MTKATIAIRQDIGRGDGEISAAMFASALEQAGPADKIVLRINSYGGSVFEATAIIAAMLDSPSRFVAVIEGIGASSAGFVALSADELRVYPESFLMVHRVSAGTRGNRDDHAQQIKVLDSLDQAIAGILARRTGGSVESWLAAMAEESWFSGEELAAMGIAKLIPDTRPALSPTALLRAQQKHRQRAPAVDAFVNRLVSNYKPPPTGEQLQAALAEYAARAAEVARCESE